MPIHTADQSDTFVDDNAVTDGVDEDGVTDFIEDTSLRIFGLVLD